MALTSAELRAFEGRTGTVDLGGLVVEIRCLDARNRYGHLDILVTPISGSGEIWMEYAPIANVKLHPEKKNKR